MTDRDQQYLRDIVGGVIRDLFGGGTSPGVRDFVRELVATAARVHGEAMGKAMAEAQKGER